MPFVPREGTPFEHSRLRVGDSVLVAVDDADSVLGVVADLDLLDDVVVEVDLQGCGQRAGEPGVSEWSGIAFLTGGNMF